MTDHLDRITRRVPNFSKYPLSLEDVHLLIIDWGFKVREIEFEILYGLTLRTKKHTYLFVNALLDPVEQTISLLHEGFHGLSDSDEAVAMRGAIDDETELEAESFALACVIPRADAERLSSREIAAAYHVRLKLARLRKVALRHFGI